MKKLRIVLFMSSCYFALSLFILSYSSGQELIQPLSPETLAEYESLSPFEFKNVLIKKAQDSCSGENKMGRSCRVLNAGRGNPNFLNTTVREAFSCLHTFASELAEKTGPSSDLGIRPTKKGIAENLDLYLKNRCVGKPVMFLKKALAYAEEVLGINPDDLVFELADAALGDFYPSPPRMLRNTENIVAAYLRRIHFKPGNMPKGKFDLFATEGATAAMIYIFQSLRENEILRYGDHIAIITPIFSPYLEIPLLNDYKLRPVYIEGSEDKGWLVSDSEIAKLEDKEIRALFMVNPMNPGSVSMSAESVDKIAGIINSKRPDLIVLTDTVYAPFVNNFNDLLQRAPANTIGVYLSLIHI